MRLPLAISFLALALTQATAEEQSVVHMLVPGFAVRELPVHISNINNLRFAPDGRLFALGYDGRIHVLRDTNGDGLEDSDELFWDKPGISVPVGMALTPEGVYVSSHGKVSLLRDTDGDGKADKEEIIASGWPPTDVASGGVDATAVTLDRNGDIYFGLITADYSNPYRVKDGVSHYDLNGKRGTIQRLSRDRKNLETIATGIRVSFALAFNKAGDLFCTDQEGETWCPNGNPLDELNHIIRGRNYGFPPAHEKWLRNLVSENPVVGFGPQHQSTCGLVFNEPKKGQGLFGPVIEFGDYVRAADRLEVLKPPYKVVKQQEAAPKGRLKIVGAKLVNKQTLALATDPHPLATSYALTIPNVKAPGVAGIGNTVDVDYDLSGFLSPTDWLSLVRTLPGGREIASVAKSGQWSVPGSKPPNYPYIHPAESEPDKGFAIAGGDYERGRALFFGDKLKCSTCHRIRGEGKTIGPDLSNLTAKDAASVLKDIKEPNASINPDYVAYNVALKDGETLTGFVRAQDERSLRLVAADGKENILKRADVKTLAPSSISL